MKQLWMRMRDSGMARTLAVGGGIDLLMILLYTAWMFWVVDRTWLPERERAYLLVMAVLGGLVIAAEALCTGKGWYTRAASWHVSVQCGIMAAVQGYYWSTGFGEEALVDWVSGAVLAALVMPHLIGCAVRWKRWARERLRLRRVVQGPLMVVTGVIAWCVGVAQAIGIVTRAPLHWFALYYLVRLAAECFLGWLFRPVEEDVRRVIVLQDVMVLLCEFLFLLLMLVGSGGLEALVNMTCLLLVVVCAGVQRVAADWVLRRVGRGGAL
ncbi:MAG: hypothetical protein ACI4XW_01815 [Candidatus Spyradocola sp.]